MVYQLFSFTSTIGTSVGIKFNNIETLISQALGDLDISHEEFIMILNETDKYERIKYNLIRNCKIKQYKIKIINAIKFIFFYLSHI